MPSRGLPSRRRFLGGALRAGGGLLGAALLPRPAAGAPALVTAESARPAAPYGAAVGDVTGDRAIVWSRSDRPARLFVEWSTRESFADARRVPGEAALEANGLTARLDLEGLPPGQRIVYRVLFQDLRDPRAWSLPVQGSFRTPPAGAADVRLAFSADTCGQGWGIDEARGGLATYESMRRAQPGPLRAPGGHDLRRQSPPGRDRARRRQRVAQPRDPGQGEGGRDPRRVPREPPLQPPRREPAPLRVRGLAGGPLGRPRGPQQLVPRRDPRGPPLHRAQRRRPRRPGAPRLPRALPAAAARRRTPSASTARCPSASRWRSSRSTCGASARPTPRTGRRRPARTPRSSAPRSSTG